MRTPGLQGRVRVQSGELGTADGRGSTQMAKGTGRRYANCAKGRELEEKKTATKSRWPKAEVRKTSESRKPKAEGEPRNTRNTRNQGSPQMDADRRGWERCAGEKRCRRRALPPQSKTVRRRVGTPGLQEAGEGCERGTRNAERGTGARENRKALRELREEEG
jgi:hypothetical protein